MKKKKGITLLEVIITIAITLLFMSLIYPIFLSGNKNLIKLDMETTLQMDSTTIENEITKLLVQSSGISKITAIDGIDVKEEKSIDNIGQLEFIIESTSGEQYEYTFENTDERAVGNKKLYTLVLSKKKVGEDESKRTSRVLSQNVEFFKVKTADKSFSKSNYVNININLYYKKGITEIEHPIDLLVTFRNK